MADRREPASDHARREHDGDGDGRGTEDRVIPPATQRSMAERAGSTITEVAGSHVSLVSHPEAAIAAILAAAAAVDA